MGGPSWGGGEAQLSKDPALGFVSKVVVRYPVYILSYPHPKPPPSTSFMALHPRKEELKGARGRTCPFLPLGLSWRAWGDWQHGKEGLVIILTELCFQNFFNSFFLCSCFQGRQEHVLDGSGSQYFL